ncbi:NADPH-dependent FMN reductase [Metabacillus malikii]|uniref:NAD(P)H-dependent FMN reductase n=1 Tax=Metabacillus malikii TaxID=1504265 RepID=A0ABT9ZIF0_9BACI|nr:NAD(P)H-dependent oxidoreductase [Metabacillus malikii]MDQ0232061.1 NAD(P)H-dependent FMN reductase [Metabacillus malikii]
MKLVGISGSLVGTKTSKAVHDVLTAARKYSADIQVELIDLKEYDVEFVRGTPLTYYNHDTVNVVNKIAAADILLFGTPIYQASITGALKNVLDHFPVDAFKGKVTGMITTAGTDKHFLVPEYQLRPILTYLKGTVPTGNVFIQNDQFDDDNEIINTNVKMRIEKLAEEMINLKRKLDRE